MEIILLILKIIGIVLLVLLVTLLILVLLVVFFPISYRISASYNEALNARVKVHWLFHLVSLTLNYGENAKSCILRLLGIPLLDFFNPKPKKEKKPRRSKDDKTKSRNPKRNQTEASKTSADSMNTQPELKLEDFERNIDGTSVDEDRDIANDIAEDNLDSKKVSDNTEQITREKSAKKEEKLSILQKIKITIKTIIQKIKDLIQKGIDIKEKIDKWVEILQRERTKMAISKAKDHITKLLKHILPRKWNAYVEMGFEDPATTGKILGYYWMFIGLYGNHFVCVPNFEKEVLVVNIDAKGRIQIFQFVYVVFKFLFDKDLVYLRKIISKANVQ